MIETLKPGTERFFKLLHASVAPDVMKLLKEHPSEVFQVSMNRIFGGAGKHSGGPTSQIQEISGC
jgi:hypothetical protein